MEHDYEQARERADELESKADELEEKMDDLGERVDDVKGDWQQKQESSEVPGAQHGDGDNAATDEDAQNEAGQ